MVYVDWGLALHGVDLGGGVDRVRVGGVRDGVDHLLHVVLVDGGGAPVVVLHTLRVDLGEISE